MKAFILAASLLLPIAAANAQTASSPPSIDAGAYIHACQGKVDDLTHQELGTQALLLAAQSDLTAANAKIKSLEDAAKPESKK
jgi:hypothetical protein